MISLSRNLKVYAFSRPADMRKGFDGLFALVRNELHEDPLNGHFYVFINKTRKRAKVLVWDGTGLCVLSKRLERGRFVAPWQREHDGAITMTTSELSLLLEGSTAVRKVLSPPEFANKDEKSVKKRSTNQGDM